MTPILKTSSAVILLSVGLAGCAASPSVESLSKLSHIHSVVIHDDLVVVGSHEGLFSQSDTGDWTRIGEHFDVMALTAADDRLLASGHPGDGFDFANPLGLIASSDGGQTWESRSLTGEVDFHLLEASGDTVIGVAANYGMLVKSTDQGLTWATLEVPSISDVAINPENESHLVLATESGLQQSEDGGASFELSRTTEVPTLLDWSEAGLFGATETSILEWQETSQEWSVVQDGFEKIQLFTTSERKIAVLDGGSLSTILF